MKKFGMFVYCRKNGVSRDSGLHFSFEAENLESAKLNPKISEELNWLYQFYDQVSFEIQEIK